MQDGAFSYQYKLKRGINHNSHAIVGDLPIEHANQGPTDDSRKPLVWQECRILSFEWHKRRSQTYRNSQGIHELASYCLITDSLNSSRLPVTNSDYVEHIHPADSSLPRSTDFEEGQIGVLLTKYGTEFPNRGQEEADPEDTGV